MAVVEDAVLSSGLMTAADVVARLRVDGRGTWEPGTLREWMRASTPLPVARRGKPGREHLFDYDAVVTWLDGREAARWEDPRDAKARAEARLAELRADEMERRLLPADEVEAAWGVLLDAQRAAWLGLQRRLVAALALNAEQTATLDTEIRLQLARLAQGVPDTDGQGDDS